MRTQKIKQYFTILMAFILIAVPTAVQAAPVGAIEQHAQTERHPVYRSLRSK